MKIDKVNGQYDTYKMEVSLGEMKELLKRLEADHAEPVADEMHSAIRWYLDNLPAPGETKEEFKDRQEQEKEVNDPEASEFGHDAESADNLSDFGGLETEPGAEDGGLPKEPEPVSGLDDVSDKSADDFVPTPPEE